MDIVFDDIVNRIYFVFVFVFDANPYFPLLLVAPRCELQQQNHNNNVLGFTSNWKQKIKKKKEIFSVDQCNQTCLYAFITNWPIINV